MTSLPLPLPRLSPPETRRRMWRRSRGLVIRAVSAATRVDLNPSAAGRRGTERSKPSPAAADEGRPTKLLDETEVEPYGVVDFVERSREVIRGDGGPPRWFTPLECGSSPRAVESPPPLFYLPGVDGVGLGLIRHHRRLGKIFDVWCLHIPVMDRTSFEGLVELVERAVKSEEPHNKPIYLVGESIGACIALAVAAQNPDIDLILILANPATSFARSQLQSLSAFLDAIPEAFHSTIASFLSLISGNSMKMGLLNKEDDLSRDRAIGGLPLNFSEMLSCLAFLGDVLPKESLFWKLKMFKTASLFVNSRMHAVKAQTLLLASGRDQFLPSKEEGERLQSALPNCRIRHFNDSGHTIFLDREIDLVTTIKAANCYRLSKSKDYVSDYLLPTRHEFQKSVASYRWVDLVASPVMLSTLKEGKVVRCLDGIPSQGPTVFVGYHMLMGWELGTLVSRLFTDKNIHLRGIAHPFMFERDCEVIVPDPTMFDGIRLMGGVPVSAVSFYKLLAANSSVLLYPGGAREAVHKKGEEHKLFWPEQSEFVRMASRFGATIIPFGVVGEDDICEVVLDIDDLVKIPFYNLLNERINQGVKLRSGSKGEVGNQPLYIPGMLPKFPGRLYYLFGKPIETKGRGEELRDRKRAQELYIHVKAEVENCIAYLKEKRERDPYRNLIARLMYQASHGFDKEIPTFKP